MPKATAVWLLDNTTLTFKQISEFCNLHPLEVQAIADGELAQGIVGMNPITTGQLTREEIKRCEDDSTQELKLTVSSEQIKRTTSGTRYTPIARRQDRPNAIYWLLKNYPTVTDAQICRLVGTTKSTIDLIRTRKHWNIQNIKAENPILLGIFSQLDLDQILTYNENKVNAVKKEKPIKKKRVPKLIKGSTTKKTAAKKSITRKGTKKMTEKKETVKKTTAKKAAPKKAAAKPAVKKATVKKTATKKVATKKPAVKKTAAKSAVKKVVSKKPAAKKASAKPVVKKVAAKKPVAKKVVAKSTKKPAAKKTVKNSK